jgi:hypothetical protein
VGGGQIEAPWLSSLSDAACAACLDVPSAISYLRATDARSDTPLPPTPAFPPSVALAIAAVAFVLIAASSREKTRVVEFPEARLSRRWVREADDAT